MDARTKVRPLLCELHAHTTWSESEHTVAELVDIYGSRGFDVLCVTDHVLPVEDAWFLASRQAGGSTSVDRDSHDAYLREIGEEAKRARERYGLLLVPGAELTVNHEDPDQAAHAVGLRRFVAVDGGIDEALREARAAGAALVAGPSPRWCRARPDPNADDAPVLARAWPARAARRPLRALQPP